MFSIINIVKRKCLIENIGQSFQHTLLTKGFDRRYSIFRLIMHYPKTVEMQRELAKKVVAVHAQTVIERIKSMSCSTEQKLALIDAVIGKSKNEIKV